MDVYIEELLLKKGITPTAVRSLVLKAFLGRRRALGLPELSEILESCDRTSIFRALKKFKSSKLIHSVFDGSFYEKFILNEDSNLNAEENIAYFLCEKCNLSFYKKFKYIDYKLDSSEFKIFHTNILVRGVCSNCDQKLRNSIL